MFEFQAIDLLDLICKDMKYFLTCVKIVSKELSRFKFNFLILISCSKKNPKNYGKV